MRPVCVLTPVGGVLLALVGRAKLPYLGGRYQRSGNDIGINYFLYGRG
jgi:hypothetical protein